MTIISNILRFLGKEFLDRSLIQQRSTQNSQHFVGTSVQFEVITPSGEDVAKAFKKGAIAKLRVATEAEAEEWRQRKESGDDSNSAITIKPNTPEEKDYAEKGYNDGAEFGAVGGLMGGFGGMLDLADAVGVTEDEMEVAIRNSATRTYDEKFESPTSSKQERLKEIYIQHYIEGFKSKTKASND